MAEEEALLKAEAEAYKEKLKAEKAAKKYNKQIIAGAGIKNSGDIVKNNATTNKIPINFFFISSI